MPLVCFHNGILLTGTTKFDCGAILVNNNRIIDVLNESRLTKKKLPQDTCYIDVEGAYISPGFIDTHVHGTGGFGTDVTSEDTNNILEMARQLPQYGVTSFCPTMYPKPIDIMYGTLANIVRDLELQKTLPSVQRGATILGTHMEGPFISKERLGVHKPECAHMPDMEVMHQFIKISKGHITNMTVAPELKGMHEIAILAHNNNILLQAGHTDAAYENMLEGIQVGITHSTHFFNAMSRLHHRNPNAVGAILIHPEMSCEIIADGYHVHPHLISLLLKNKSLEKLVLITDALSCTGLESPHIFANGEEVLLKNGLFHRKEDGIIAGSALTMIQGVRNLISWNIKVEEAIRMASHNPAEILHVSNKGSLIPGYDADIVVFDKNFNILYTMINGTMSYQSK